MLGKMCRDRVKVTEDDLKRLFENKYGEKRQAKIICWNKGEVKAALRSSGTRPARETRSSTASPARRPTRTSPPRPGRRQPVGKNAYDDSPGKQDEVERVLFSLKVGEISQLFETPRPASCA